MTRQPELRISAVMVRVPVELPPSKRAQPEDPHIALEIRADGCQVWDEAGYTECGTLYPFKTPQGPLSLVTGDLIDMPHFDAVYRYLVDQHAAHRTNPLGKFLGPAVAAMDQAVCKRDGSRVYFAQAGERIKIGWSRNVAARITKLQTGNPEPIRLLATTPGGRSLETQLHERFADVRLTGEWFAASPALLAYVQAIRSA